MDKISIDGMDGWMVGWLDGLMEEWMNRWWNGFHIDINQLSTERILLKEKHDKKIEESFKKELVNVALRISKWINGSMNRLMKGLMNYFMNQSIEDK